MNEADPRVKRTRKLLQDAFMELLAERSFQAISVQDIAERATLNRATFYAHFEDKYALMDYMIGEGFRDTLRRHLTGDASFTLGNLRVLVVTVCEFLGQFHGHCAPARHDLDPRVEAKVQQELSTILLDWLREVSPVASRGRVSREAIAASLSWAIFGAGIEWSRREHAIPVTEWAREVVTVLVSGIAQVVHLPQDDLQGLVARQ